MTTTQIDYTVIIPHYNIPDLLRRCLRSIPEQDNIQVIVVDDCSPEADKYLATIPELLRSNVEFCSTLKGGSAGRARNVGIERANGIWLTFLDADDLFVDDITDILELNKNRTEDAMFFRTKAVYSDDLTRPSERNSADRLFKAYFHDGDDTYLRYEYEAPHGKFVKKKLVDDNDMRFEEIRWSNDGWFNNCIGVYAKDIYVSKEIAYILTEREGSLTADDNRTYQEWKCRYDASLRKQELYDANHIRNNSWTFATFLFKMWHRNKQIFFGEFNKLTFRNKWRVVRYAQRHFFGKHPV